MEEIALKAVIREEKPKKVRREGFIPGVLNGPGTASTPVQFESTDLNKMIARHGTSTKLWVMLGSEKKFGFMKELQRNPVDGKPLHVSIQMTSENQDIKMQLPIQFHGHGDLEHNLLQLQVYRSEAEVEGKAALIPDEIVVEVSDKKAGEGVTAADFHLPEGVRTIDPEGEVYAVIKAVRAVVADDAEETEAAAEGAANQS
ncbi:50S ribosomal protein L25 [Faecalispora anaeroviscerum]|uniref:50S ribosomal protein L25 n=1 Tax=Faecalispora anaeroviscerum TaxID=2991836 RepID=UPI0024B9D903|nr:50S ribosomal protein L25 [Faecalispora anaeroviscerum]